MPRKQIQRVSLEPVPVSVAPDYTLKLLDISGWNENEIDAFIAEFTHPEERTANVAFFSILIQKIEESEFLHLKHDLPRFIEELGFHVPDHLSTFLRFVRRHTENSFRLQHFSELSQIPAPLKAKPSIFGKFCEQFGITEYWLFNCKDSYTGLTTFTIGLILELLAIKKKSKDVSDVQCARWVQRLFALKSEPHSGTIRLQWERIFDHWQKLRCRKDNQNEFLQKPYLPPSNQSKNEPLVALDSENKNEIEISDSIFADDLSPNPSISPKVALVNQSTQCDNHFPTLKELASIAFRKSAVCDSEMLYNLQKQIINADDKLKVINKKIGHYATRNVNKRDRRASINRKTLDKCLLDIDSLKVRLANALKLSSKWKLKASDTECDKCVSKISKIVELNDSIRELEHEKDCLKESQAVDECEVAQQNKGSDESSGRHVIKTLVVRDGHYVYNDDIRLVYMELLSLGIAIGKCSDVVKTVIGGLTDLEIEKLPAKSTTSGFQSECETVAQMHVADVMLQNKNLTLHLDGSKKKFKEYGSFQVTRSVEQTDSSTKPVEYNKETLSMGLQEMSKGDTKAFIDTLLNVLGDLAEAFSDQEKVNDIKMSLLSNISNLMTDRHVVNKAFRVKLEETRRDLFEQYLAGFQNLSTGKQDQLVQLHGMYCGLHVLTNMGTVAAKGLKVFEEIALPPGTKISEEAFEKGNSRSFDLIFELSQSMTISGSMRSGKFADWDAFIKEKGKHNHIVSFLRHRFNVLFVNGAGAYYHREDIQEFLELQNKNKMMKCVSDSILSPVCIAALRALGIFAVLVTQPLWRMVERQNVHVFDLNKDWLHLKNSLEEFSTDSSSLLNEHTVFPDFAVQKNMIYEELFLSPTGDIQSLTKECLEIICFHTHNLVKRQLEDQLPGGKYAKPTVDVWSITKSCPTSNRAGEKDFSDLDREVNRAPQRSTNHISGAICFRNNKTWTYFQNLPKKRRQNLIQRAIKLAPQKRLKNRLRRKEVRETRMRDMKERKKKAEKKKSHEEKRLQGIIDRVQALGGVWDTSNKLTEGLGVILAESKKIEAIKDQIRYQTTVLNRKFSISTTKFTVNGQRLSLVELSKNFHSMIASGLCGALDVPKEKTQHKVRQVKERRKMITNYREMEMQKELKKTNSQKRPPVLPQRPHLSVAGKLLKSAKTLLKKKKRKGTAISEKNACNKKAKLDESKISFNFQFTDSTDDSFIACAYEDKWYLGQIFKVHSSDYADIRFMKQVGPAYFKWPEKETIEKIDAKFILKTTSIIPTGANLRIWKVDEEERVDIDNKYKEYSLQYFKN